MMKRLLVRLWILCPLWLSAQQTPAFHFRKMITVNAGSFAVDNLGNLFVFSATGQLKKLDDSGDSVAVFNDVRRYGKLYAVDVSNPLKVLLYYKDYGTVLVLDRLLNVRTSIDLRKLNLFQVNAISQAYDNGIWVFDEWAGQIKHIGDDGRVIDQSVDLRQVFDSMPSPRFMTDENKLLYLYDVQKGVYLFDYYGSFKSRIPLIGWQDFTVVNDIIFGRKDNKLFRYQPGSLDLQEYDLPPNMINAKSIKITPQGIYLLRDDRIEIYDYR